MKSKKILGLLIRFVISGLLIGYFLVFLSGKYGGLDSAFSQIFKTLSAASLAWLVPALLLHMVGLALISFRWKLLLKAQGAEPGFGQLFLVYFIGTFFNNFLPSTIGGDAVRAIESKRFARKGSVSMTVVIVERFTGLLALILITLSASVVKWVGSPEIPGGVWLLPLGGLVFFLLVILAGHHPVANFLLGIGQKIFPRRINDFLNRSYQALSVYYSCPGVLFQAVGISIIFQMNMVLYYFLIAKALNQNILFLDFMINVPIMMFMLMVIPAINGLGIRTAGFKELMKLPAAIALSAEFIDIAMRLGYGLLGGVVFLFYKRSSSSGSEGET